MWQGASIPTKNRLLGSLDAVFAEKTGQSLLDGWFGRLGHVILGAVTDGSCQALRSGRPRVSS